VTLRVQEGTFASHGSVVLRMSRVRRITQPPDQFSAFSGNVRGAFLEFQWGWSMKKVRILVVEAEAAVATQLVSSVVRLGHEATLASNGEEAVRKAGEIKPDLILMDLRLGGAMDGIQAAQQIRTFLNVPVVYLATRTDLIAITRAADLIYNGCLVKPFSDDELAAAVAASLERQPRTRHRD